MINYKQQILALTKNLITVPSTQDNPKALRRVLEVSKNFLHDFTFQEFEKQGNYSLLFYNNSQLPKRFRVILNAHLDVVQAKPEQYHLIEKNGKLYGRGTYDMKAAGATMIVLFKNLAKKLKYAMGLQLVTDEEVGGFNGTKYQIEQGIRADFVIAGENTDLKINHISKGIIWLKLKTKGKSAHGAYPWEGENAIWKMHQALKTIEKLYPVIDREMWCTTANLSIIETPNKTINQIPDECTTYFDIRYIPEEKDQVIEKVQKNLSKDIKLDIVVKEPAHLTQESNEHITILKKAIQEITGKEAEMVKKHGASDIRHFNQAGCEGVTFGPTGAGHHSDEEWVYIKGLIDYCRILEQYLTRLN